MKKAELKIAVEKHGKDIRAWVRQAPLGATYAPRTQGNSYPTPTFSQATPSRHKAPSSSFGYVIRTGPIVLLELNNTGFYR